MATQFFFRNSDGIAGAPAANSPDLNILIVHSAFSCLTDLTTLPGLLLEKTPSISAAESCPRPNKAGKSTSFRSQHWNVFVALYKA